MEPISFGTLETLDGRFKRGSGDEFVPPHATRATSIRKQTKLNKAIRLCIKSLIFNIQKHEFYLFPTVLAFSEILASARMTNFIPHTSNLIPNLSSLVYRLTEPFFRLIFHAANRKSTMFSTTTLIYCIIVFR